MSHVRAGTADRAAEAPYWFVAAHSMQAQFVRGVLEMRPVSLVHAKRMGTVLTACGERADTWPKLFHLRFPAPFAENCRGCLAVVSASGEGPAGHRPLAGVSARADRPGMTREPS